MSISLFAFLAPSLFLLWSLLYKGKQSYKLALVTILSIGIFFAVTATHTHAQSTPYSGTAHPIPGTIEAEDYDNGGEGVAYHDMEALNQSYKYRTSEGVDIAVNTAGGYSVGWTANGEWLKYTVNVLSTGDYVLQVRVGCPYAGKTFRIEMDGSVLGTVAVPVTGSWQTWQDVTIGTIPLTAGSHVMRLYEESDGYNIDSISFLSIGTNTNSLPTANAGADQSVTLPISTVTLSGSGSDSDGSIASYAWSQQFGPNTATIASVSSASTNVLNLIAGSYRFRLTVTDNQGATSYDDVNIAVNQAATTSSAGSPYGGVPRTIPGTIEAEDYDLGGEGVGYHDTDANNAGLKYRTSEGVDISDSYDTNGGYSVGWTVANEWTNYTVNVTTSGTYVFQARIATMGAGNSLGVLIDGNTVATLTLPVTGGWTLWKTITVTGIPLSQGTHVMRILNVSGNVNINYFVITANAAPQVTVGGEQTINLPTNSVTLTGSATDPDGTIASYSWTRVKGTGGTITSPTSATTTVTGLTQGIYTFRLTATDNKGATEYADVGITVYGQIGLSKPIAIDVETMVINDNAVGDENKLFDEQNTLSVDSYGNPLASATKPLACPDFWNEPANSHACWSLFDTGGIRDIVWPATLTIDLKAPYNVTDAYVFIESASANGAEDDFEIKASDDPFNFVNKVGGTKFQTATYPYQQWIRIPLTVNNNRYLQMKITSGAGKIGEIVFYGTQSGNKVVENISSPATQQQHYPIDKFIGTNVSWGMGDGYDRDYDMQWGTLRTYSGYRWIFDKNDNIQLGSPGQYSYDLLQRQLNAGTGEKPYNVEMGASLSMVDPNDPAYTTSSSFSDRKAIDYTLCQGTILVNGVPSCHGVADKPESYAHKAYLSKKAAAAYGPGGQFKEEFIELGNEPDGSWNQAGYYTPYELAAMMSADYDGHCNALRYNGETVGAKNGDPNIKVMMPGIVAMGSGDMRYLKSMYFWWQHHRTCAPVVPTDVINFHFYSSSSGGQGTATGHGISPEDYGMRDTMKKTVDFRNKYAPKVDVAVTEFGYDSYPEVFPNPAISWCKDSVFGGSIIATHPIGSYDTDEVQGQWIARSYLEMAAAGIDFANQFWLADEYKLNTVCGTFAASGMVKQLQDAINWRPQYVPRPGWYYAQTLKTQLKNMKYESDRDVNGVRIMKFRDINNSSRVAYTVWSPTSNGYTNNNYTVTLDRSGAAQVVNLSVGSETGQTSQTTLTQVSSVTLPVSERPTIVLVNEGGSIVGGPIVNAGSDQALTLPATSTTLSGSATSTNPISTYTWTKVSGGTATIGSPSAATTTITGLAQGTYTFRLTVTDNQGGIGTDDVNVSVAPKPNTAPAVNAGVDQSITLPINTATLSGTAVDAENDPMNYTWSKTMGGAATISTPNALSATISGLAQGTYTFILTATDSQGAVGTDAVTITVNGAPNISPTANAGLDQILSRSTGSFTLTGTGTDADGTIASYAWSQVSGPIATISSPLVASTKVSILNTGVYIFRLTVADNLGAVGTDDVSVTVQSVKINKNPRVKAATTSPITTTSSTLKLSGTAADDDGTIVSTEWTQVSGPQASISSPTSLTTDISGLDPNTYEFSLAATDNDGGVSTDTVRVIVSRASSGGGGGGGGSSSGNTKTDNRPTVSAGGDQTITLPLNSVVLNGAGSDVEGQVSYSWNQISGPKGAKINASTNAQTMVTSLTEGRYVFSLTVTDGKGQKSIDQSTITVSKAAAIPTATNQTTGGNRVKVNVKTTLRIRSDASIVSTVLGSVRGGISGKIIEEKTGPTGIRWVNVQFDNGTTGWVSKSYTVPDAAQGSVSTPSTNRVTVIAKTLNVRSVPGGKVTGKVSLGAAGTVLNRTAGWVLVQFPTVTGYVSSSYVR